MTNPEEPSRGVRWREALWLRGDSRLDLLPLAVAFFTAWYFAVELPRSDDWQLVPVIERFRNGTADFTFLSTPFNQHRMLVSYCVMAGLAIATHWHTVVMQMAGMLFFLVGWLSFRVGGYSPFRLFLAAVLFWGLHQYGNFNWTWQVACLMAVAMGLWAVRLLAPGEGNPAPGPLAFVGALALAAAASLSYGFGVCVWPALFFVLASGKEWKRLALAVAAAALLAAVFFRDGSLVPAADRGGFLHVAAYFFSMLGTPFGAVRHGIAAWCGVVGLGLFLWAFPKGDRFLNGAAIFGLAGIALATYTRSFAEVSWAEGANPRYATEAMLVWIPAFVHLPAKGWRGWLLALLCAMTVARSLSSFPHLAYIRQAAQESSYALRHHQPGGTSLKSSQTDDDVARYAALLEEWHYSVFRE